jgi:hypothetical protein
MQISVASRPPSPGKPQAPSRRGRLWADARLFGVTYFGGLIFTLLLFV